MAEASDIKLEATDIDLLSGGSIDSGREFSNVFEDLLGALLDRVGGGSGSGSGGGGGGGSADIELLLGQLEDKLLRTQHDLEDARRAHYFPAASGFSLRFSYNDTYVGFKARLPLFPPPLLPPPPARARGSV